MPPKKKYISNGPDSGIQREFPKSVRPLGELRLLAQSYTLGHYVNMTRLHEKQLPGPISIRTETNGNSAALSLIFSNIIQKETYRRKCY